MHVYTNGEHAAVKMKAWVVKQHVHLYYLNAGTKSTETTNHIYTISIIVSKRNALYVERHKWVVIKLRQWQNKTKKYTFHSNAVGGLTYLILQIGFEEMEDFVVILRDKQITLDNLTENQMQFKSPITYEKRLTSE